MGMIIGFIAVVIGLSAGVWIFCFAYKKIQDILVEYGNTKKR